MHPSRPTPPANLDLVAQVGALIGTGCADPDLFAPDVVFRSARPTARMHGELGTTPRRRRRALGMIDDGGRPAPVGVSEASG